MIYFIIAIIAIFLIKFLYDRSKLGNQIKASGGIKEKYRLLITRLTDGLTPIINQHNDHLVIKIKSESLDITYNLLPAFDILIVELVLNAPKYGTIKNKWNFNENNYNQVDMAKAIEVYIESALEKLKIKILEVNNDLPEDLTSPAEGPVLNIISSIKVQSLAKKTELALLIYSMCIDEEKAFILNTWYQYKHNNPYINEIEEVFIRSENPRYIFHPCYSDKSQNLNVFKNTIALNAAFANIEKLIIDKIGSSKFEYEIDRLLFIVFALSGSYNVISDDLLSLCKADWNKEVNKLVCPYYLLIIKTLIDVLILKDRDKEALNIIESNYSKMTNVEYEGKFNWLKYQYVQTLIELHIKGFPTSLWSIEYLYNRLEKHSEDGLVDDSLNEMW